jgi:hypothetical protein
MGLMPAEAHHPITTDEIANETIQKVDIGPNAVGQSEILTDGVGKTELAAGSVGLSEILTNGVGSAEIAAGAVGPSEIATNAVGALEIAAGAVGASEIANDAVGAAEIVADAVGSSEIATGAVGTSELASNAVTTDKIGAGEVGTTDLSDSIQVETATLYSAAGSFQLLAADLTLGSTAGSADGTDPDFLGAAMGNVLGNNLTNDANYVGGVIGHYSVTGTNASTYPVGAVLGGIGDGTSTADGAFVAYIDGDSAVTTAEAAFKVMNNNSSPASGFDFGLDLQDEAHDNYQPVDENFYLKAPLRLVQDVVVLVNDGAPTSGPTGTGNGVAGKGSLYIDTTNGVLYINTGTMASPTWTIVGEQGGG